MLVMIRMMMVIDYYACDNEDDDGDDDHDDIDSDSDGS